MFDQTDLRAAVDAGVLSAEQAQRLEGFLEKRGGGMAVGDPESLRFLANFNDIFISIGLVLLLAGVALVGGVTGMGAGSVTAGSLMALLPVAAVSWLLAEYFCARRRLLLPSMVLATGFALSVGLAVTAMIGEETARDASNLANVWSAVGNLGLYGAAAGGGAALAFFARFRLPFALFLVAVAVALLGYTAVGFFGDIGLVLGGLLSLVIGAGTLVAAIGLDMADPKRATRKADYAFWLHLAAAPQIILGLRGLISGVGFAPQSVTEASILLSALLIFAVLSLALNRRALIVSSLLSYGLALQVLVESTGSNAVWTSITTLLLLGGAVVLIGGGWSTARRAVLGVLPKGGIFVRLFPPEPA